MIKKTKKKIVNLHEWYSKVLLCCYNSLLDYYFYYFYLITLNCLDGYMKCYQWARSIPLEKKFNETHFLADIDLFFSQLKNQKTSGETLCEKEAAAKAYAKNVRQTPRDKAVEKTRKYLKDNGLLAVLLIRGLVFA